MFTNDSVGIYVAGNYNNTHTHTEKCIYSFEILVSHLGIVCMADYQQFWMNIYLRGLCNLAYVVVVVLQQMNIEMSYKHGKIILKIIDYNQNCR